MNINNILEKQIENSKIKNFESNDYILVADKQNIDSSIRLSLLTKILQNKYMCNALVLTDIKKHESLDVFKIFGIKKFYVSFKGDDLIRNIFVLFKATLVYLKVVIKFFINKKTINRFIDNFTLEGIHVGDLIYDTYIRKNHNFKNIKIFSFEFYKIFIITFLRLKNIKTIFQMHNIKTVVSSSKGFNFGGTLTNRYASKLKIDVYIHADTFFKKIKSYTECTDSIHKVYQSDIDKAVNNVDKSSIDKFISERFYNNKYGNFIPKEAITKSYLDTKYLSKKEFLDKLSKKNKFLIDENTTINLVALNCFTDCPRSMSKSGVFIFRDFYDFFLKTMEKISSIDKDRIWLIKSHPANLHYNEGGLIKNVIDKFNLSNVFMCPEELSNTNYFQIIDNLVTARSTIALEYACFGKSPIICGSTPYSGFGFTEEPTSDNEYYKKIEYLNFSRTLKTTEINTAKQVLYILDNFKMSHVTKSRILPDRKELAELNDRISFQKYTKELMNNINNNKINSFLDDPYFKSLSVKIN